MRTGAVSAALKEYDLALRLDPRSAPANSDYAWALATSSDASLRNAPRAVELAEQARNLTEAKDPVILRTLAVAYAATGNFPRAIETAEAALKMAEGRR